MSDTAKQEPTSSISSSQNITLRMMTPIVVATIVALAGAWLVLPERIAGMATKQATLSAAETVTQFKTLRAYYTKNIRLLSP